VTGEYTFAIFAVTVIALVLSWMVSVYFRALPGHAAAQGAAACGGGRRPAKGITDDPHEVFDSPFYTAFAALVNWCVQHRWITIGATVLTFALGIVGMGKVQQQFFPDSAAPKSWWTCGSRGHSFAANEEVAPSGWSSAADAEPGVSHGQHLGGLGRAALLPAAGPGVSADQRVAVHRAAQGPEGARVAAQQAAGPAGQEFPEVRGRVKLLPNGPPVPYPVQFRVVGPDPLVLRERPTRSRPCMRANPNMRGVNDNWNESVKVLRLEVDQAKARALGVTSQSIAQASDHAVGTTVGQYREGDKLIDIVLRQPLDERNAITDIANAYLPTASGKSIPLTQIAKPVFTWEPGVMWRENRDYAITVQGDVTEGCRAPR
jgi:multidrug efflux pump